MLFKDKIKQLASQFADRVVELTREHAFSSIGSLGATAGESRTGRLVGSRGEKRSSDSIDSLRRRFVDFVSANPGLRIEQINKQLGTTTRELMLPIRRAITLGDIRTENAKRSMTYFSGSSGKGGKSTKVDKSAKSAKSAKTKKSRKK